MAAEMGRYCPVSKGTFTQIQLTEHDNGVIELTFPPETSPDVVDQARDMLHRLFEAQHHVEVHAADGRRKMPETRRSVTHKFEIDDLEGYLIIGLYEDLSPGECFIIASKHGGTVQGLLNVIGILISLSFQYGIPQHDVARKMIGQRFEPQGRTKNNDIPSAFSVIDYIFRWFIRHFPDGKYVAGASDSREVAEDDSGRAAAEAIEVGSGIYCPDCGNQLIATEGCLKCFACGYAKC